jgi:DNA-binding GntR family transcriptional regulator
MDTNLHAPLHVPGLDAPVREPLTERAYRQLEEAIVTLDLRPGEVVTETALADRLGLGRTPIREALLRLAREHLVRIMPRRGIVVAEIDVSAQLRLLDVRRALERVVAHAAASNATAAEQARFAEIADDMMHASLTDDAASFMRLDAMFNAMMLCAARNEFATAAMGTLHGLARRFWFMHWRRSADLPLAARLHAEVARAVAAGKPDAAVRASDALLAYLEEFTRATLATF